MTPRAKKLIWGGIILLAAWLMYHRFVYSSLL
jgi:hypothetical protein